MCKCFISFDRMKLKLNFSRLVEDDAFMQYDLRNGNSVALAEFPPDLVNQHSYFNPKRHNIP
jgi:hypothetical protein